MVFIIFDSLFTVLAFVNGSIASGLVGLLGIALYILSFLFGLRIIKTKAKNLHIITTIVALILAFPFLALMGNKSNTQDYKDFDWNDIELHEYLPEPKSHSGEIISNTDESLYMGIKASESEFDEYVKDCKEMGYTVEANESNQLYSAYNSDGYDLSLIFYDDHYSLNLDVPEKMEEIEWPDSDLAKMLPVPKSKTGKINNDSSNYLRVSIDKTSESDFKEYVKACKEKGFDVDYSNGDNYYRAKNSKGYSLEVSLSAFDVMDIYLSTPKEETTEAETSKAESSKQESSKKESSKSEQSSKSAEGVTPEFKEAMDSYEEFFDEYIDFMVRYSESDNPIEMMDEYYDYLNKYSETMQELSDMEDKEVTDADRLYYIEVQTRILDKLSKVE